MTIRRCAPSALVLLFATSTFVFASSTTDCPKAASSSKGNFLVIIERELEKVDENTSNVTKMTYEVYPREEFRDDRINLISPATFWDDWLKWSVVHKRDSDAFFRCPEPLITDDGKFLVLLNDQVPSPNTPAVRIYRAPASQGSTNEGVLVREIGMSEIWPAERFPKQLLATGADPYWFAGGSFEFSPDDRLLIYKASWGSVVRINLANGSVSRK